MTCVFTQSNLQGESLVSPWHKDVGQVVEKPAQEADEKTNPGRVEPHTEERGERIE